jgi:fluoride ion exporter CrcB/FEX
MMHTLFSYIIVFVGAGIGGAMRHGVNVAFRVLGLGSSSPYETLTVNVVGSLAMGVMAGWFALKFDPGPGMAVIFNHRTSRGASRRFPRSRSMRWCYI